MNRIFNATGQTVGEVIRVRRLARAREDLAETPPAGLGDRPPLGLRRPEPLHPQLQSPLRRLAARVPDSALAHVQAARFNYLAPRYKEPVTAR